MFSEESRDLLRATLIAAARADERIFGAAVTGSASVDREDVWSDIDLALGVSGADAAPVIEDWTDRMYAEHGAIDHVDVRFRNTVYRVFVLDSTLQVDIAFAPEAEFGPIAPTFRPVFGTVRSQEQRPAPAPDEMVGLAWLYALHIRSSLGRGRLWQAEHMIAAMRELVLGLASIRYGLAVAHARGRDDLPGPVTERLRASLVGSLDVGELVSAFSVLVDALLDEVAEVDRPRAARIEPVLRDLVTQTGG